MLPTTSPAPTKENMCREYDYPNERAWNVDEWCCAGKSQAACETGYHYVRSNEVCDEECDKYYYSCEKCADDVECVGVGCENCDPHYDIYSEEGMSYDDTCEYWTDPGPWFWLFWELLTLIFAFCIIASLTFGIMGLWNARRVLGTGQQLLPLELAVLELQLRVRVRGAPLSASTMYNANVYLSGCNLFMLIMNIIVEIVWAYGDNVRVVLHGVLGGVTAAAAVQLKQKKEHWNAPIGVQPNGQPAHGQVAQRGVIQGTVLQGQVAQGSVIQGTVLQGQVAQGGVIQGTVVGGPIKRM